MESTLQANIEKLEELQRRRAFILKEIFSILKLNEKVPDKAIEKSSARVITPRFK